MFDSSDNTLRVPIPKDNEGYTGRQCPSCGNHFKIVFGTGLKGTRHCICPYCGHRADQSKFTTDDQIEYAKSVALNRITGDFLQELRSIEGTYPPQKSLINITIQVEGEPSPIMYYMEPELETKILCQNCTLAYAIYGVFGYCPDCGQHNSLQILEKNLELATKFLSLADEADADMRDALLANALSTIVSAIDGFGREICNVYAPRTTNPNKASDVSFQNVSRAQQHVQEHFGFDIAVGVTSDQWKLIQRLFQKRHLIAHKAGVIDDDYLAKANDPSAIRGHKIALSNDEAAALIQSIAQLGFYIVAEMSRIFGPPA